LPKIILTVTNDLTYDQRMQRICTSLAAVGYQVLLVGRKQNNSKPLTQTLFGQKRLECFFNKGFAFYAEYNLRLFWWLLFKKTDIICAIDLDTILPVLFVSTLRGKKRVYDAHELFTEQIEIIERPSVHKVWLGIEKFAVPKFAHGYTVNQFIADEFKRRYGVRYEVIRNLPVLTADKNVQAEQTNYFREEKELITGNWKPETGNGKFIIYQGAVNEGRCFETLIPAMKHVDAKLIICGEGNFFEQVKQLIKENGVENKVELKGYVLPEDLKKLTPQAHVAVTLFEHTGLNQYYSLGNRFFDYIMAGVPQVCVDYPEYRAINNNYNVAYLIPDTTVTTIAAALNKLLNDDVVHKYIAANCIEAREHLHWQSEANKLVKFYNGLMLQ
jgi:glycosyltransferase involved in cell wall biosynthesis